MPEFVAAMIGKPSAAKPVGKILSFLRSSTSGWERHQKVIIFGDRGHPCVPQTIGLAEATQANGA